MVVDQKGAGQAKVKLADKAVIMTVGTRQARGYQARRLHRRRRHAAGRRQPEGGPRHDLPGGAARHRRGPLSLEGARRRRRQHHDQRDRRHHGDGGRRPGADGEVQGRHPEDHHRQGCRNPGQHSGRPQPISSRASAITIPAATPAADGKLETRASISAAATTSRRRDNVAVAQRRPSTARSGRKRNDHSATHRLGHGGRRHAGGDLDRLRRSRSSSASAAPSRRSTGRISRSNRARARP